MMLELESFNLYNRSHQCFRAASCGNASLCILGLS